jgi:hypothetical protein
LTEPEEAPKKRGRPKGTSTSRSKTKNALGQVEQEALLNVLNRIATALEILTLPEAIRQDMYTQGEIDKKGLKIKAPE